MAATVRRRALALTRRLLPAEISSGPMCGIHRHPPPPDTVFSLLPSYRTPAPPHVLWRRFFSTAAARVPMRPLPTTHMVEFESDVWVNVDEYIAENSLVFNQNRNPLNTFGDPIRGPFEFSAGMQRVAHSLVELVVHNANKGYYIGHALKEENLLISRTHHTVRLKSVSEVRNLNSRTCVFVKAKELIVRMVVKKSGGDDIECKLSSQVQDLLYKMSHPSDERLIVFHVAFLHAEGKAWLGQKIHRIVCKQWQYSSDIRLKSKAQGIAKSLPNCREFDKWTSIVSKNPFLDCVHQISEHHQQMQGHHASTPLQPLQKGQGAPLAQLGSPSQPSPGMQVPQQGQGVLPQLGLPLQPSPGMQVPQQGQGVLPQLPTPLHQVQGPSLARPESPVQPSRVLQVPQQTKTLEREGFRFIAHYRNVPVHCFDKDVRKAYSAKLSAASLNSKEHTYEDAAELMDCAFPDFLLHAVEGFLAHGVWEALQMERFFHKDFGHVQIPDYTDFNAPWSRFLHKVLMRKNLMIHKEKSHHKEKRHRR